MDVIKVEDEAEIGPTEYVFETVDLPAPSKNISLWSNGETKLLIDLYKGFISEVGPLKRFMRKKDMWHEISLQITTKNAKQCEERFKTLLRRKKKGIVEKVYMSEGKRKTLDLEDNEDENEFQVIRKHKLDSEIDDSLASFKQVQVWSNEETKLLMDLYKRYICEVGPQKRFMHKKDMWTEISTNFQNKDAVQCLQRYNTVLKRKKENFTKVYISKARGRFITFKSKDSAENAIKIKRVYALKNEKAANDNAKIDPNIRIKQEPDTQETTVTTTENKEVLTISETLLKIAAKQEEAKERRHREKMEAIEKIHNMLQQIVNSTPNFY